jgi:hypothetical protein
MVFAFSELTTAMAADLNGPGRFCGYAPIIDLLPGESVTTLQGGVHGGSFRWDGAFGNLEVHGIGWASPPKGRIVRRRSDQSPARFNQKKVDGSYQIAIWNGAQAAAYFSSPEPFTRQQITAIDRVMLYQEGQEPVGCKLRTAFSWD